MASIQGNYPAPAPKKEQSLLSIINELNRLQYNCGCSLEKLHKALDHLKAINGKVTIKSKEQEIAEKAAIINGK